MPVIGKIIEHTANWRHPDELIPLIKDHIAKEKTVMVLASCSYMLNPVKNMLKDNGLAFHNPFRRTRGDWNPLGNGNGTMGKDILSNFLGNGVDGKYWNVPQFVTWAQFVRVGDTGLRHKVGKAGIKALKLAIEDKQPGLHTTANVLTQVLTDAAAAQALKRDTSWLADNLLSAKQSSIEYPLKIYKKYGIDAVEDNPKIILGTIHSVKGEDCDVVVLFPDISWQAYDEMQRSEAGRDALYRVFYVGMTRPREELVICSPAVRGGGRQKPKMFVQL